MSSLKSKILLADDHGLVRRGLRLILDAQPDLEVLGEAGDGAEALELALSLEELDLAVLDISMPRMTGLQAAREIHARRPELPILVLSMHESEQYLYEALKAGASGYVVKKVADRDLVEACRASVRGEPFLYPGAITTLVAESYTNRQIAEALVISEKTVEGHRANILEKLGLHDRVGLTRYAIRNGLVEP